MSDVIIKAEEIGKLYRLGEIGTGTISHDLNRWWAKMRGREDPFAKVGQVNDRTKKATSDWVWALKDINFEVKQGEVLGIIGRNGAGKSTLLKILSKVTTPSVGRIKVKGRIASLLEVGTGFHPELTGRENIFLNGAILGMSKGEIKRKFDEIVDFSGVERYIDTPVKRYSSGMYVRLAFAVAAFLEPEILIVDEVLAVGDADFQKKCMGRMQDVSKNEGRTVLFVSHQLESISRLCSSCILLDRGMIRKNGATPLVIDEYQQKFLVTKQREEWLLENAPSDHAVRLLAVYLHDESGKETSKFEVTEKVGITMEYEVLTEGIMFTHGLNVYNDKSVNIFNSHDVNTPIKKTKRERGRYKATAWVTENLLPEGLFSVGVALFSTNPLYVHIQRLDVLVFQMFDSMTKLSARGDYAQDQFGGIVRPLLFWEANKINQ